MTKRIAVGGDHAGFSHKQPIVTNLQAQGYEVIDLGTFNTDSVDYPDFAHLVASSVENGAADYGILVCGTGNGVAITANKHEKIRAGLAWNTEVASLIRQHNDANIICLPARFISIDEAFDCVHIFLNTDFEGGRHARRVEKMGCV